MRTALIAGATGLIGKELVQQLIRSDQYSMIYILSRRKTGIVHAKIKTIITDFGNMSQLNLDEPIDDAFCMLGTTMKQAGSRDQFKKVDYHYILAYAALAKKLKATKFLVISSMGADSKSPVFYSQVKGMTEEALKGIGFKQLVILRPSLLLGKRTVRRFAERVSGFLMKGFNFLIPDNYKAIRGEKVANYMLKMALRSTGTVTVVKSGEMLRN